MDNIVSMPVLRVVLALMYLSMIEHNLLKLILNMSKQVSSAATAAVQEANQPRVFNLTIAGARRNDATTSDGTVIEGVVILFRGSLPVIIDGEEINAAKKWFRTTTVVDALIMSEDDNTAAKAISVMEGDWMALRGTIAKVSVFEDEDAELHYKLEF